MKAVLISHLEPHGCASQNVYGNSYKIRYGIDRYNWVQTHRYGSQYEKAIRTDDTDIQYEKQYENKHYENTNQRETYAKHQYLLLTTRKQYESQ